MSVRSDGGPDFSGPPLRVHGSRRAPAVLGLNRFHTSSRARPRLNMGSRQHRPGHPIHPWRIRAAAMRRAHGARAAHRRSSATARPLRDRHPRHVRATRPSGRRSPSAPWGVSGARPRRTLRATRGGRGAPRRAQPRSVRRARVPPPGSRACRRRRRGRRASRRHLQLPAWTTVTGSRGARFWEQVRGFSGRLRSFKLSGPAPLAGPWTSSSTRRRMAGR